MSLARSFHSDPYGMIFIHASCDQPLMNSPITKLLKFCHSEPCVRNLIIRGFRDPSSLRSVGMTGSRFDLAYIELTFIIVRSYKKMSKNSICDYKIRIPIKILHYV